MTVPWPEARRLARALGEAHAGAAVCRPLEAALGHVLAAPLQARADLPVSDRSAMDGWAVCGPEPWRLVGRVLAGGSPQAALQAGTAVEVATGAPVPAGAERVLPSEHGRVTGGLLRPHGDPPGRRHVRRRGEEARAGEQLLPAGTPVTPAVLALAAAAGHDDLPVRQPPTVAVLVTGDELRRSGLPAGAEVRDALGPALPGIVAQLGGALSWLGHCGDPADQLAEGLGALRGQAADVLVTCGMAGPGRTDGLRRWLAGAGAQLVVDGVAVRPGHPQLLGVLEDGRPLVGLPGNPLAAVSACLTLLGPLLAGLARATEPLPRRARLTWPAEAAATTLLPVRVGPDGSATPVPFRGAAQLRGLATADAVAVVPPGHRAGTVELLPAF